MKKTAFFCLCISTLISTLMITRSIAQSGNLETDRPGQTLTAFTTPKKWMQTELGFSKESNRGTQQYIFQYPQLLIKYGLFDNLELRLLSVYGSRVNESVNNGRSVDVGISDLQLGAKLKLFKQRKILPHTSLIAHYMFNSMRTSMRDTIDGMHARLAMQHSISSSFTLNYNAGINWPRFGFQHSYLYSFSPRFYFAEKWMLYAEVFGNIWNGKRPKHNIDGGVSFSIDERLKVDASYGRRFGLNHAVNFISIGGSFRFITTNQYGN